MLYFVLEVCIASKGSYFTIYSQLIRLSSSTGKVDEK